MVRGRLKKEGLMLIFDRAWHRTHPPTAKCTQAQTQFQPQTTSFFLDPHASRLPVAIFRSICFLFLNDPTDTPVKSTGRRQGFLSFFRTSFVHLSIVLRHITHTRTRTYRNTFSLEFLLLRSSLHPACSSSALPPTTAKREMQ